MTVEALDEGRQVAGRSKDAGTDGPLSYHPLGLRRRNCHNWRVEEHPQPEESSKTLSEKSSGTNRLTVRITEGGFGQQNPVPIKALGMLSDRSASKAVGA